MVINTESICSINYQYYVSPSGTKWFQYGPNGLQKTEQVTYKSGAISYSYITSRGRVLITMISYECL